MGKLKQVADGVWVRQSDWVWSNSIVVRGEDGLVLIDPGIDGSELDQLADDVDGLGVPVVAGFCTHPHWDHLLWHSRFGDVPRYATTAAARVAGQARERAQAMAAESASGVPLDLVALVTPLPADGGAVPGQVIEHQAHAVGHASVLLADRGVLLVGDMLSDILIPLFDARQDDQVGAYESALDRLAEAAGQADVVVPGHGSVAEGREVAARFAAERAYIDALRRGDDPVDARLGPHADWLSRPHRANMEQARGRENPNPRRADRIGTLAKRSAGNSPPTSPSPSPRPYPAQRLKGRSEEGVVRLPPVADLEAGLEGGGGVAGAFVAPEAGGTGGDEVVVAVEAEVAGAEEVGVGVPAGADQTAGVVVRGRTGPPGTGDEPQFALGVPPEDAGDEFRGPHVGSGAQGLRGADALPPLRVADLDRADEPARGQAPGRLEA
ncbi:MBL fold metallo-hydrolase [Streptomyces sp. NPDC093221]|uniref:MBL fold metallo-hydrolase n=1 Tax=Streptomyces sp. NPDC093221 TaxID=3366032 RepID=UPI00381BB2B5